jgi:hypothetical protein
MTVRALNRAVRRGLRVQVRYRLDGKDERGCITETRSRHGVIEVKTGLGRWAQFVAVEDVWGEAGLPDLDRDLSSQSVGF